MTKPKPTKPRTFRNEFHAPVHTLIQAGTVEYHQAPNPVHDFAKARLMIGRIPGLAANRQDRESDRHLAETLGAGEAAVRCQIVSGLGGVGKTQTAAAYARAAWDSGGTDLLVWVRAAERASIVAAYANAAVQVCGADPTDSARAAQEFLSWLDRPDAPRWLIVLDDLDDPEHLAGLWPPDAPRGRTVVTTRRRDAALEAQGRQRIDLGLFTEEEASTFLTRRLGAHSHAHDGADELIEALGRLPIALAQAAAYILDQPGTSCRSYLAKLDEHALHSLRPEHLPDEYPLAVGACWAMSIYAANSQQPKQGAIKVLNFLSLLDPAGVPAEFFTTEAALFALGARYPFPWRKQKPMERDAALALLARLHKLSLIDYDGRTVRTHALVQRFARDRLPEMAIRSFTWVSAEALAEIWPYSRLTPEAFDSLRDNISHLGGFDLDAMFTDGMHLVLVYLGEGFEELGRLAEAENYYQNLREECESRFGPDNRHTLMMRHNLHRIEVLRGRAEQAAVSLEAVLDDHVQALGRDDPETLRTRDSLALARGMAGEPERAVEDLEALLADAARVFGADDSRTLEVRSNLAYWAGAVGEVDEQREALEALLPDQLSVLGPDAPKTLATRLALIKIRGDAGDPSGAVADLRELHADMAQTFGANHPFTIDVLIDITSFEGVADGAEAAITSLQSLLLDIERVLGPQHPQAKRAREHLEWWEADLAGAEVDEPEPEAD